jgi:hypothetical protein
MIFSFFGFAGYSTYQPAYALQFVRYDCVMFNPRTAIVGCHLSCPPTTTTTTTTCFAITVLASLLVIDHNILTPPVIMLDILPMLDDWTRRCSNSPRMQLVPNALLSNPGTAASYPLLQVY